MNCRKGERGVIRTGVTTWCLRQLEPFTVTELAYRFGVKKSYARVLCQHLVHDKLAERIGWGVYARKAS